MRLKIIREDTLETFELSYYPYGPYVLDSSTVIPAFTGLDTTGYEYSGRDGGYQTSSRLQRRPLDINFFVREDHTTDLGLFELLRAPQRFFDPHTDSLTPILYTIEFYSDDKTNTTFMLRHGTISVPLSARTEKAECVALASISYIFGDPYFYPIGDAGPGITRATLHAEATSIEPEGRLWDVDDGASWSLADGKLWDVASGESQTVTVDVQTSATVNVAITLTGQLINPTIINLTNNSRFKYNGTLTSSDTLTVSSSGQILLNGFVPSDTWEGTLTATDGPNTFSLQVTPISDGEADLLIRGAF